MSDDYGSDFITVTDEDGNDFELEHLGTLEYQGNTYMAFVPADIDDEAELNAVYEQFMEELFDDEDEENG